MSQHLGCARGRVRARHVAHADSLCARRQEQANCFFVIWYSERDILQGGANPNRAVEAVAIHAARDIQAGTELTLHYGALYARDYDAGHPPKARPTKADIKCAGETPASESGLALQTWKAGSK